jgi:hypothetical protein
LELLDGEAPARATKRQEETEYRHSVQESVDVVEHALVRALRAWRAGDVAAALRALDEAMVLAQCLP